MTSKFKDDATLSLLNSYGRVRLTLIGFLACSLLVLGFLLLLKSPAQAWTHKYASCSSSACHSAAATTSPPAVMSVAVNGTASTSVNAAPGSTFEVDWMFTNMRYTTKYSATAVELAVPTGWTVSSGTVNSPALTGWSSTWDVADGVGWMLANSYSTATEFPNSPTGYTINYDGTSWDNGNRNSAFDDGSAGDLDGVANKMGTDARITVPAGTLSGTYTVMLAGIGHNESDTKAHIEQAITVNVVPVVTSTSPNSLSQGTTQNVVITGAGFTSTGLSSSFGAGITVNSTTYNSATQLTANITIDWAATAGARNVSVTCSGQTGTGTGVFSVTTSSLTPTTTTVNNPATITYGETASFTATVSPTVATGTVQFKVDGVDVGTPATVSSGSATISGIVGLTAGNRSVTAVYSGDSNYASSTSAAVTQTVIKATPTLSVTNSPVIYDGSAKAATVSGSVAGTASSILTGGAATQTNAGTYAVTANFTPTDSSNYNSLTTAAAGNFIINPATPTASITNSPVTYTGSAQTATVACLGGGTATLASGGTGTNAGSYPATVNCAASSNYSEASGLAAGSFVINKATPTLSVTNSPVMYDGSAKAATVSGSVAGTASSILTGGAASQTEVGTYAVTADFAPTDSTNYNSLTAAAAGNFVINAATQTASVTNSPVTYNTSPQAAAITCSGGGAVSNVTYNGSGTVPANAATYAVVVDCAANGGYSAAAGVSAGNFVINPADQTIDTITFNPATLAVSGTSTVSASATSGLTVNFSSDTESICTVSGNVVTGISAGTCTIRAIQAGNVNYNVAPAVTQSLEVTGGSSTVTLTVTTAGDGTATVYSSPGSIVCARDNNSESGVCIDSFTNPTDVTLTAAPDWKTEVSWTGGCTATGNECGPFTLSSNTGITATFTFKQLVTLGISPYATIQDAYNAAIMGDTTLKARDQTFTEDLLFDGSLDITFIGGHDADWNVVGDTTVIGTVTIADASGSVTISNLIIQ